MSTKRKLAIVTFLVFAAYSGISTSSSESAFYMRAIGRSLWSTAPILTGLSNGRSQEEIDAADAADLAAHGMAPPRRLSERRLSERHSSESTKPSVATSEIKMLDHSVVFSRPVTACVNPGRSDTCRELSPNVEYTMWKVSESKKPDAVKSLTAGKYAFCVNGVFMTRTPTTCEWVIARSEDVLRYVVLQ
jgi:hypothetical protein